MSRHAIFMAFDQFFGKYARACINSIKTNYPDHPEILVFYRHTEPFDEPCEELDDIVPAMTEERKEEIKQLDENMIKFLKNQKNLKIMEFKEDKALTETLDLGPVDSPTIFLRYMLWSNQFDEYDNILHLDVDTLVMKPLDDLINQEDFFVTPNHEYFDFVRVFRKEQKDDPKLHTLLKKDILKYPDGMDDMCNAGIFVIPKKYRTKKYYNKLVQLTKRYNDYLQYADQSAISLWCRHFKIPFQAKYEFNFQTPYIEMPDVHVPLEDAHIIHFSSEFKPDHPEFKSWWRLLKYGPYLVELFESYLEPDLTKRVY